MSEKVESILDQLENAKQNLLDLSEDIWEDIDHNDNDELEEWIEFKKKFNNSVEDFSDTSEKLKHLLRDFTKTFDDSEGERKGDSRDVESNERIIEELDRETPHTLDEDFRYKRPFGFIFDGVAAKDLRTWKALYVQFCETLAENREVNLQEVADNSEFTSSRGNKYFSSSSDDFTTPESVGEGVYAETNYSANQISERIRELIEYYGYDPGMMHIYLREDRDASSE